LTYFAFPSNHWRQVRTNNPLERINLPKWSSARRLRSCARVLPTRLPIMRFPRRRGVRKASACRVRQRPGSGPLVT